MLNRDARCSIRQGGLDNFCALQDALGQAQDVSALEYRSPLEFEAQKFGTSVTVFAQEPTTTMNYFNTFIEVAADCKVTEGTAPRSRAGNPTVAELEFEFISREPYSHTHEDVQFHVHSRRKGLSSRQLHSDGVRLREAFFAKPMACMRASPLAKTYGWGLHFNEKGHVALVSVDTSEYRKLAKDPAIAHTRAMRNRRT